METVSTSTEHPIDRYIAARRAEEPKFSKIAFAEMCGVSRTALYRIVGANGEVSLELFELIERGTEGAITVDELVSVWRSTRRERERASA